MPISAAGTIERRQAPARCRRPGRVRPGASGSGGVSLIELLVAVAIVEVMAAAVVVAFPDLAGRSLEAGAARVRGLLELACERAERSGRDLGIAVAADALAFGPFIDSVWRPLPDDPGEALRPHRLASGQTLRLRRDGVAWALPDELPSTPQLACLASGERTPFELELRGPHGGGWRIVAPANGAVVLERLDDQG